MSAKEGLFMGLYRVIPIDILPCSFKGFSDMERHGEVPLLDTNMDTQNRLMDTYMDTYL